MSTTGWAVTIIVIIIILAGGWWYFSQVPAVPATTGTTAVANGDAAAAAADTSGTDTSTTTQATGPTIHFTSTGFEPKDVTIQAGQKVTFVNDTAGPMWVASDAHPTHTGYDGTDRAAHCSGTYTGPTPFDQCQPGSTYTFVFTKAGAFTFHNHMAAQYEGTVTVQ